MTFKALRLNTSLPSTGLSEVHDIHNGAKIFEILSDGENIGGGLQLFSLEEIEEELKYEDLFEDINGIPIGYLLEECHLMIDKDKVNQGDPTISIYLKVV